MFKKLCALIMAFVMVASLCAVQVNAAGGNGLLREDYSYFKGADALSGAINAGDTITAKCNVYNTNDANQDALLITALYSSSGDLAAVNYASDILLPGATREISATVSAPATPADATYTVDSFLWDGFGTLVPCVDIDTAAPAAPVVTVGATTTSTVALSWETVADTTSARVLGYKIYRDGVLVGTTGKTATSFTDTNAPDGAELSYTVAAYGLAGETASAAVVASTKNIATVKVADLPTDWFSTGIPCANADFDTEDGIYVRNLPGSYTQNQQVPFKTPSEFASFVADEANVKTTNVYSLGTFFGRTAYASFNMSSSGYGLTLKAPTSSAINTGSTAADRTMVITYYDNGTDPFFVRYRVPNGSSTTWSVIDWNRTNTNKWLTKEITLSDALLKSDNQQIIFAPSTMSASSGTNIGYDPVYIAEVGIAIPSEYASSIPAAPATLTAATTTSSATLAWAASATSSVAYNVYRNGALVTTTTDLTYTDRNLADGTDYSYAVCAVNASGIESTPVVVTASTKNIETFKVSVLPDSFFTSGLPFEETATRYGVDGEMKITGYASSSAYNPANAEEGATLTGQNKYLLFYPASDFQTFVAEDQALTSNSLRTGRVYSFGDFFGDGVKAYASYNMDYQGIGLRPRVTESSPLYDSTKAGIDAVLTLKYYDNGTDDFTVVWKSTATGGKSTYSFNRTNTNQWITAKIDLAGTVFYQQNPAIYFVSGGSGNGGRSGNDPLYIAEMGLALPAEYETPSVEASFAVSEFSADWFSTGIPFGTNKTDFSDGNIRIVDFPASFSPDSDANETNILFKSPADFAALVEGEEGSAIKTEDVYSLGEFFGEKAYAQYNMLGSYGITINIPQTSSVATPSDETPEDRTLVIRYYDNGTDSIDIRYRKGASSTYATVSINRTGTNKWLEKEILLEDAVLYNASRSQHILFDGAKATGNDPIYISSVAIVK